MTDGIKETPNDICCICGNLLTMYTKNECSVTAPWGRFVLHYHKACETPQSKKDVAEKVKEIALANKP